MYSFTAFGSSNAFNLALPEIFHTHGSLGPSCAVASGMTEYARLVAQRSRLRRIDVLAHPRGDVTRVRDAAEGVQ